MYKSVDATVMRQFNKRTVLHVLYQRHETSRVSISSETGLNRATVSSLVDELIAEQFVQEIGLGTSHGGRKPILLRFNADAGYAIGIDLQITHIDTVLTNTRREVVYQNRRQMDTGEQPLNPENLQKVLAEEVRAAQAVCPESPRGILGVGVALPGLVNYETGSVTYLPNLGITEWPIAPKLSEHLQIPVAIDNDANCGAWEAYLSTGIPNLLFINAGIGVGAGIILNGKLHRGRDGIAGEAGHTTISTMGVVCSCGNNGCWEQYSSEQALARYLREQGVDQVDAFAPHFIDKSIVAAEGGSHAYIQSWRTLAEALGVGISNLLQILNPDCVYLGGTIAEAATILLPEIHRVIRHRAMYANKTVPVSVLPSQTVARGAAGLAIARAIDMIPTHAG